MILALISSTLDQLPEPEVSLLSEQSILTPLSLRAFPRVEDIRARQLGKYPGRTSFTVPSLRELLVHYCRVHPDGLDLQQQLEDLPDKRLVLALQKNVPFYLQYNEDAVVQTTERAQRRAAKPKPRVMFLSSATLVIVPANLLNQWTSEMNKHCKDSLRRLIVRDSSPLPSAMVLASSYDVSSRLLLQTRLII